MAKINWVIDHSVGESVLAQPIGIQFFAQNRPLHEILLQLVELRILRFFWKNETIYIMKDEAYVASYDIQFLLGARHAFYDATFGDKKGVSDYASSVNAGSMSGSIPGSSGNISNAGQATVRHENSPNFWKDLEDNLDLLIPPVDGVKGYSIHQYGGVLTICAHQHKHALVAQYINKLKKLVTAQVLVEAKIIEIELNNSSSSGFNFDKLKAYIENMNGIISVEKHLSGDGVLLSLVDNYANSSTSSDPTAESTGVILKAMKKFGNLKILSEPRLLIINNQTGILSVATQEVFFSQNNQQLITNKKIMTIDHAIRPHVIPVGILMIMTPSISSGPHPHITLSLRFTYSNKIGESHDKKKNCTFPIIQNKDINTVCVFTEKRKHIVIGGMMVDNTANEHQMGFFSGVSRDVHDKKTEFLMLMSVTIPESMVNDDEIIVWMMG